MASKKQDRAVHFKINAPQFLKEVFDNYPGQGGVLKVPANVLRRMLWAIAERASEMNDPVLNGIMCDMALYAIADPYDKENFDLDKTNEVVNNPAYVNWRRSSSNLK